jgi:hypothetical protein
MTNATQTLLIFYCTRHASLATKIFFFFFGFNQSFRKEGSAKNETEAIVIYFVLPTHFKFWPQAHILFTAPQTYTVHSMHMTNWLIQNILIRN